MPTDHFGADSDSPQAHDNDAFVREEREAYGHYEEGDMIQPPVDVAEDRREQENDDGDE